MKTYRRILGSFSTASQSLIEKATATSRTPLHGFQPSAAARPTRKRRLFPSRPTKLAATGLALGLIATSQAAIVSTVSVDFLGNFQPATLSTPDIAGVIPANTWGVAPANTGTLSQPDTLAADNVDFFWIAPDSATIGNPSATNDQVMMDGYLMSGIGSSGTIDSANVRVTSIDLGALGWAYYDVYVYSDTGKGSTLNQIDLFAPGVTNYSHDESSPGYGMFGFNTYLDSQVNPTGNYVVYSGLTANMFNVSAYHTPGASNATAINGIQLVGHSVPEPSTGLLAILSTSLLLIRRKRS